MEYSDLLTKASQDTTNELAIVWIGVYVMT